jgi:RecJ-like exonuclease
MRNICLVFTMLLFFMGTSFSMDKCQACKGTGKRQCDYCDGRGDMGECDKCMGLGMFNESCHDCNGTGRIIIQGANNRTQLTMCGPCKGTGSIRGKCSRCMGRGRSNKCMTCLGTGIVKCIYCDGSGNQLDQKDTLSTFKNKTIYGDTLGHIPMVVRQIELDECTSLSFVAEDTIKPKTITIIFASEDSLKDDAVTILNPYSSDVSFSQEIMPSLSKVVKKHKIIGVVELSWNKFEQFIKLNPMRIVTKRRAFELTNNNLVIISSFHQYLVDRH